MSDLQETVAFAKNNVKQFSLENLSELVELIDEALSTTYRFIDSHKGENQADTTLCMKSAEFHLTQLGQGVEKFRTHDNQHYREI